MTVDELKAKLDSYGIEYNANDKKADLEELLAIAEEEAKPSVEKVTERSANDKQYKNCFTSPLVFGAVKIPVGGSKVITSNDLQNTRTAQKVAHALKIGLIKEI